MLFVRLRELRPQASELVRRVEEGESFTVTVSGRPAARLVPTERLAWRTFGDIAHLFDGPADPSWCDDAQRLDPAPRDPWSGA